MLPWRTLSKRQVMWLTITSGVVLVFSLFANVQCLLLPSLIGSAVFGLWWLYKYQRDQKLIEAGREQDVRLAAGDHAPAPPRATKGSSWLGVPPQLDR